MGYCVKCGAKVEDGIMICPQCGAQIPVMPGSYQPQYYGTSYGSSEYFGQDEVRRNKAMGVLSYIGILVLIPLLAGDRRSEYVKHHMNQGIVLTILSVLVDLLDGESVWGLYSMIHFNGGLFSWTLDILDLGIFVLCIVGIVSACRGDRKELPLIGKLRFFK